MDEASCIETHIAPLCLVSSCHSDVSVVRNQGDVVRYVANLGEERQTVTSSMCHVVGRRVTSPDDQESEAFKPYAANLHSNYERTGCHFLRAVRLVTSVSVDTDVLAKVLAGARDTLLEW